MNKELKQVLDACEQQGFTLKANRRGHTRVFAAGGEFVTGAPGTPSDRRGWDNMMAALKRHGFRLDL